MHTDPAGHSTPKSQKLKRTRQKTSSIDLTSRGAPIKTFETLISYFSDGLYNIDGSMKANHRKQINNVQVLPIHLWGKHPESSVI